MDALSSCVRVALMIGMVLVVLVFVYQSVREWRSLQWGQKMLAGTLVGWGVYIVNALHAALSAGLHWSRGLGFLAVGLVSFAAFLMEPKRTRARRHARMMHEVEEDRFQLLIDAVADYAIFMLDPNGIIVSWNTGAQRIKGYTEPEALGRHFRMFYPLDQQEARHPEHNLELALRDGHYEESGWRVRKDGTAFWANVNISAVHDPEGRHLGFAKVTRKLGEFPPPVDNSVDRG